MKELNFSHFVYKLYMAQGVFVGFFDTYENAKEFAMKYYRGNTAYIIPCEVFSLKKKLEGGNENKNI